MVEWLERLDYGAESRREVVSSRLGFAMRQLEHSLAIYPLRLNPRGGHQAGSGKLSIEGGKLK